MTQNAEQNDSIFELACDDLTKTLQANHDNPEWVNDVMAATDRLCAVMDLLRHKLDGLPLN